MLKQDRYSILGMSSLIMGIFNISISIVIYWALWSYINSKSNDLFFLQARILNVGSIVELVTKPLGLLLGVIGLFQKNTKKTIAIIGVAINLVVILWTLAVIRGLFIWQMDKGI